MPTDFLDGSVGLVSRSAVDAALRRLVRAGAIRRLARGVYDLPRIHPRFGRLVPAADAVARAVARSTGESICVGDAKAANLLGVSTQVPAQAVYLTDGTNRTLSIDLESGGAFDIRFQRSTRRAGDDSVAGLVLRALHFLGRDGVDAAAVRQLRSALGPDDLRDLASLRAVATGWMRPVIDRILMGDEVRPSGDRDPSGA